LRICLREEGERKMNSKFSDLLSLKRLGFLIKRDVFLGGRSLIITFITLFLIVVVLSMLNNLSRHSGFSHLSNFSGILFIAGYGITAGAFRDIHSKVRAYEWFMLPASLFEKFLARLIITSIGWAGLFIVLYGLASLLGESLNLAIFGYRHTLFNPLDGRVFYITLQYLITQSVFLFGAVYFKKNHFIKTLLGILLVGIGFVVVLLFVWRIFFWGYLPGGIGGSERRFIMELDWSTWGQRINETVKIVWIVLRVAYYVLFAPFFWLLTYFRIAETEVRDGV